MGAPWRWTARVAAGSGVALLLTFAAMMPTAAGDGPAAEAGVPKGAVVRPGKGDTVIEAAPPLRRVPPLFGQLDLSSEQKERIYSIRGRYAAQVAALNRKIAELKVHEIEECEEVLDDDQRDRLAEKRAASRPARAAAPDGP